MNTGSYGKPPSPKDIAPTGSSIFDRRVGIRIGHEGYGLHNGKLNYRVIEVLVP